MNNEIDQLVSSLVQLHTRHQRRVMIALAGPPGSGKSTLAEQLVPRINDHCGTDIAIILPMDGFHLDNVILDRQQSRDRKGAPHTFDADGFINLVNRVSDATANVVVPVFDRQLDLARAGASMIQQTHQIILVEGNYLLLNQAPWQQLYSLFDHRIYLDVPESVLITRLTRRWLDHDHTQQEALARAESNDLPNARLVAASRLDADQVISTDL